MLQYIIQQLDNQIIRLIVHRLFSKMHIQLNGYHTIQIAKSGKFHIFFSSTSLKPG